MAADIPVQGSVANIALDSHLWIAVRKGKLLWPKDPEVQFKDGAWAATVSEGGTPSGGHFELVLLVVDKRAHQQIQEWLRAGNSTGRFPGLARIQGATELHAVQLTAS